MAEISSAAARSLLVSFLNGNLQGGISGLLLTQIWGFEGAVVGSQSIWGTPGMMCTSEEGGESWKSKGGCVTLIV